MSSKKVLVKYKGNEELIDMEINEDNLYNSFLDIFRQKFNENDPLRHKFKLTTINTSIPYLLLDENNISNIIKEKIPNDEPLILLLTKEEDNFEEKKRDSLEDNFFSGYFNVKDGSMDDEDFKDECDFIIKDEDKNLNNISNKIKTEQNKKEEDKINIISNPLNKEENKVNQEDKYNIDNKDNKKPRDSVGIININELKNEQNDEIVNDDEILNLNENLNIIFLNEETNKDDDNLNIDNNKKKINNKYLSNLPIIPLNISKNIFNSEICTLCGNTMLSFKYICSICENCNLCEKCEEIHIHPCFKYKTNFLSNLTDTYKYIDRNYNYKIPIDSKKMTKLIRKEYNLKIVPMTDLKFSVRPNKIIDIPVKLLNLSDHEVNSSQFIVLIKNTKLIHISYELDNIFVIKPQEEYELKLTCRTSASFSKEKINIEIYSSELKIRMSSRLKFDLEIDINEDKEDEKLNKDLNNDKYAIFHTKQHKQVILSMIYYKENWKYNLKEVCQVLRDNKWDAKKSIEVLSKNKK